MARQLFANNVVSLLSAAVVGADTTLNFTDETGFPVIADGSGDWFYLTLLDEQGWEIVKVVGGKTSPYTVVRGVDGTYARDWPRFTHAELRGTAASFDDIQISVENLRAEKAQPSGIATLDSNGKLLTAQLPSTVVGTMQYQGGWDALTNTPTIGTATEAQRGHYYVVTTAGNTTIDGISDWQVLDWIVCNGTAWSKIDNTDQVLSVAGKQGLVTLNVADIIGLQDALDLKQNGAALEILHKILSVDGTGSNLDADLLDGHESTYFEPSLLNPPVDGWLLSSYVNGTREWVAPYTHPTGDGNLHVPANGSGNANNVLKATNQPGVYVWSQVHWGEILNPPATYAPTAHASTHAGGGTDPLLPANAYGWLFNPGDGILAYTTPTPAQIGALPSNATAVDSSKLGGQIPSYYLSANTFANTYTAADVLAKLKTVDGTTSGLDADLLDGYQSDYFLDYTNLTNKPVFTAADVGALPADGVAVDATKLGGQPSSYYLPATTFAVTYTASDVLTKLKTVDGAGSGLDADLLDGHDGSYFLPASSPAVDSALLDGKPGSFYLNNGVATFADAAAKLQTPRAITISGDADGTADFDGTANVTIEIALDSVAAPGTYTLVNVDAKGRVLSGTRPATLTALGVNTGAGSGLDADLLDGHQGSYFAPVASIPEGSSTLPLMDGVAAIGTGTTWARHDHVHASDTSRLAATATAVAAAKLATARTIAISGDITGTATSFDGTTDITITASITDQDLPITCTSNNWGQAPSNGFHALMGAGTTATWLLYGTSGGAFRYGIQGLDSGGTLRIYADTNYLQVSTDGVSYNGTNLALTNQTMYIGTTSVAINRASAPITLTGVSIDGSAASANALSTTRALNGVGFDGTADVTVPAAVTEDAATNNNMYIPWVAGTNGNQPLKTSSAKLYFNPSTGALTATKVYNAVFNDIADFLELDEALENIQYGRCYVRDGNGTVRLSSKAAERGIIGIASDTYGYGLGRKDIGNRELPVAIGGFVLAYCDQQYRSGDALTCGPNGILTKASFITKWLYPERIVATFFKSPGEKWNGVQTRGRSIVKIR